MSRLSILYWNVYVGHNPDDVKRELMGMVKEHDPEIIGLGEAMRLRGLHIPGYKKFVYERVGNHNLDYYNADTTVFVRDDVELESQRWMELKTWWSGPKHGLRQPPKRYFLSKVKVGKKGEIWRVSVGHWPFNTARPETLQRITNWFEKMRKRVAIHVGDLNTRADDLASFVRKFGADQTGHGVDRTIFRHCTAHAKALGKHGSDHEAVLFTYRTLDKQR